MSEVEFNRELFAKLVGEFGGQTAFAEAVGVSRQYINALIQGGSNTTPVPSVERLLQFKQILNRSDMRLRSIDDLLIVPKALARKSGIAEVVATD